MLAPEALLSVCLETLEYPWKVWKASRPLRAVPEGGSGCVYVVGAAEGSKYPARLDADSLRPKSTQITTEQQV